MLNKKEIEYLESLKKEPLKKILFVCLGNICRSPAADGIMKSIVEAKGKADEWYIDSAGMGRWHIGDLPDKRMRVHALKRGLVLDHRCRQVNTSDFDEFDLIIGMDDMNMHDLKQLCPTLEDSRKLMPMGKFLDPSMGYDHVPDPYYDGAQGFETVLDLLEKGCENIFDTLSADR